MSAKPAKKKSLRLYFVLPRGAHPELFDLLEALDKGGEAHQYARTLMILGFEARCPRLARADLAAEPPPGSRSAVPGAEGNRVTDHPLGPDLDELLGSYTAP